MLYQFKAELRLEYVLLMHEIVIHQERECNGDNMNKQYLELFKGVTHAAELLAEQVSQYKKEGANILYITCKNNKNII